MVNTELIVRKEQPDRRAKLSITDADGMRSTWHLRLRLFTAAGRLVTTSRRILRLARHGRREFS
ncbi:hypothetical protein [Streptomyces sp. NPDC050759]|uniref:hypothetical protein n=1 Tax=Streptomyces sp. NPDC050759 TaxID=3365635 RepID=UPI0037B70D12